MAVPGLASDVQRVAGVAGGVPGVVRACGYREGAIPGTNLEAQIPDISDLSIYMIYLVHTAV